VVIFTFLWYNVKNKVREMWSLILLILLAVLAVLILAAGYFAMNLALRRGKALDPLVEATFQRGMYARNGKLLYESSLALSQYPSEDIEIKSFDGLKLHGRLLPLENAKGTILQFHGYRSCPDGDFGCAVPLMRSLGYQVLLVDQRAHQQSEGRYITFGILERQDALYWARAMEQRFGPEHPLYFDGISMGAATVLMAASLPLPKSVRGIIADSGFSAPRAIIGSVIRRLHLPEKPLFWLINLWCRLLAGTSLKAYSVPEAMAHCTIPVLFVHGKKDSLVPWEMTQENYDACQSRKTLLLVDEADHGASFLVDRAACEKAIADFLK